MSNRKYGLPVEAAAYIVLLAFITMITAKIIRAMPAMITASAHTGIVVVSVADGGAAGPGADMVWKVNSALGSLGIGSTALTCQK